MPNVVQYTEKLQKLKNTAISYFNGPSTSAQVDLFLDELKSMREANDLGFLTGNAKKAYDDLIETLKAPQNETPIHKYIKKRAMDTFALMVNDSRYISNACYYSELYEFVSNDDKLREERTEYDQKREAEERYNNEIRNAFKDNDQDAIDQAIADRENNGLRAIRNQLKQVGYEKGGIFKTCLEVIRYSEENAKKENKTEKEQHKFEQMEQLRKSHLFIPYINVVNDFNNDKEKILYNDGRIQDVVNRSKRAAEQAEQAKRATEQAEQAKRAAEQAKKTADFAEHRNKHVAVVMEQFKKFDEVKNRVNDALYSGRKTDNFKQMYSQIMKFDANKWNNEGYKKYCLDGENIDRYHTQIKNLLESVDKYITYKQRQFFPGRLGKARLNAAKEMKAILTGMQISMQNFKTYSNDHPREAGALLEEENAVTNAIAAPYKLYKEEKKTSNEEKLTREQLLAPYRKYLDMFPEGKFRTDAEENMLKTIRNKEKKTREKISFAELRNEMKLPENKADKAGKNKRQKTMEDIQPNRKLKLESPVMKK